MGLFREFYHLAFSLIARTASRLSNGCASGGRLAAMNWAAHPILYQLTHWWHWLTYGQNTAALGLIGLGFYTYYTQRMMKAAEETRRLSLTPFLVAEVRLDFQPPMILVTNVAAPAVRCEAWMQTVSTSFKPGFRLRHDPK